VQGLVTLHASNSRTGGFCVIPGSHLLHDQLMEQEGSSDKNFFIVPPSFLSQHTHLPHILPICEPGDMILWDSRTIHCNTPAIEPPDAPVDQPLRIAGYVSMVPTEKASTNTLHIRRRMYEEYIGSNHWPHILPYSSPAEVRAHTTGGGSRRRDLQDAHEDIQRLVCGDGYQVFLLNNNNNNTTGEEGTEEGMAGV
jgi:hypothetical protein